MTEDCESQRRRLGKQDAQHTQRFNANHGIIDGKIGIRVHGFDGVSLTQQPRRMKNTSVAHKTQAHFMWNQSSLESNNVGYPQQYTV